MKTAICDFTEVQESEAWEARECNYIENPYCNCKACSYMIGFKKTKLINGENVILVDCIYGENELNLISLKNKIDQYLKMSVEALEDEDLEKSIKYVKRACELKMLLVEEDEDNKK